MISGGTRVSACGAMRTMSGRVGFTSIFLHRIILPHHYQPPDTAWLQLNNPQLLHPIPTSTIHFASSSWFSLGSRVVRYAMYCGWCISLLSPPPPPPPRRYSRQDQLDHPVLIWTDEELLIIGKLLYHLHFDHAECAVPTATRLPTKSALAIHITLPLYSVSHYSENRFMYDTFDHAYQVCSLLQHKCLIPLSPSPLIVSLTPALRHYPSLRQPSESTSYQKQCTSKTVPCVCNYGILRAKNVSVA